MNSKIYNGNVQPNPKEYKIWVNDEGIIKTWNGEKWVESASSGGSGSGSGSELKLEYYKINHSEDNQTFIADALYYSTYLCYKCSINGKTLIQYIGDAYSYIQDNYQNVYKIACLSIPIGTITSDGDSYRVDEGSWKSNFIKWNEEDYDEELFDAVLTPITKEEFYTFDNPIAPA